MGERRHGFLSLTGVSRQALGRRGCRKFKTVTYRVIPEESTRIAMIQTGEADIVGISRERVPELQARGFKVFVKERGSVMGCYFHQQWEDVPVADKRVRQALNLAINREELAQFIFAGQAMLVAMYPIGSFAVAAGADQSYSHTPTTPIVPNSSSRRPGMPMALKRPSIPMPARTSPRWYDWSRLSLAMRPRLA